MSALTEIRTGRPSTAFSDLLIRTVLAVALRHGFPPPEHGKWTKDSASSVAAEFLARKRAPKVLEALALGAGDDRELAAQLQGAVRNFLRDRGRTTEMGRLVVRLRRALKDPRYQTGPGGRYALVDGPVEPSEVPPDALVTATAGIRVEFVHWSPTARRKHPFASRASIDDLVKSVMVAAEGSLTAADVAHAVAPALQVVTGNELVELDPGAPPDTGGDIVGLESLGLDVLDRDHAFEVFGILTDREKISLGNLDLGARQVGPLIGLGHTQANEVRSRVIEILREELDNAENGQAIAELVIDIAKFWVAHRTSAGDETYGTM